MRWTLHRLVCLILALGLGLSGPGAAASVPGGTLVVLCAGDQPETVWLDARGNPVSPVKSHAKCLDCLLFSAPLPGKADVMFAGRSLGPASCAVSRSRFLIPVPSHLRPATRAPPVPVGRLALSKTDSLIDILQSKDSAAVRAATLDP